MAYREKGRFDFKSGESFIVMPKNIPIVLLLALEKIHPFRAPFNCFTIQGADTYYISNSDYNRRELIKDIKSYGL